MIAEIIELNLTNCKEYTDEEILAKIAKLEAEADFDLSGLFDEVEENEEVAVEEESDFVKLTKKLLAEAEVELAKWTAKEYKKSTGSTYVGSEMDGNNYSFNYINNKRRQRAINNALSDIAQYKKDLGIA